MIITLDGPTASGKSAVAELLVKKLGGVHFNSGLIYRLIGHAMCGQHGEQATVTPDVVNDIVRRCTYVYDGHGRVLFDGIDVTHVLKDAAIDQLASQISTQKMVRDAVNAYAHTIQYHQNLIVDGRDCGTSMFPNAEYKFFITASLAVRARRWQQCQKKRGNAYTVEQAQIMLNERDTRDMHRSIAPLTQAPDAIVIDT